jgi:hypothetical protein
MDDPKLKRRFPRFKVDLRVRVTLPAPANPSVMYGRGNELGQGGMAITVDAELQLGDMIEIELPVLGAQPLKAKAEVRNREGRRYGVEFVGFTPEQLGQLSQLCELLDPSTAATVRSRRRPF